MNKTKLIKCIKSKFKQLTKSSLAFVILAVNYQCKTLILWRVSFYTLNNMSI